MLAANCLAYLTLPVVRVAIGVRVQAREHLRGEEQNALSAVDLREEVLLIEVVRRQDVALLRDQ